MIGLCLAMKVVQSNNSWLSRFSDTTSLLIKHHVWARVFFALLRDRLHSCFAPLCEFYDIALFSEVLGASLLIFAVLLTYPSGNDEKMKTTEARQVNNSMSLSSPQKEKSSHPYLPLGETSLFLVIWKAMVRSFTDDRTELLSFQSWKWQWVQLYSVEMNSISFFRDVNSQFWCFETWQGHDIFLIVTL